MIKIASLSLLVSLMDIYEKSIGLTQFSYREFFRGDYRKEEGKG